MKQLILINGTMGAGKTTVSKELLKILTPSVFLDGDWCWMMNPFVVNEENKTMVLDNIGYLLRSFLQNSGYEYVIFCWVIQEEYIFHEIFSRLEGLDYRPTKITLQIREEVLRERLGRDIAAGLRQPDVVERSVARLPLYQNMDTIHLDVSEISPQEAAQKIAQLVKKEGTGIGSKIIL